MDNIIWEGVLLEYGSKPNEMPNLQQATHLYRLFSDQKEKQILQFILKYQQENMPSPSYRDIAKFIGLKTTNSIHKYLYRLKENGYVDFVPAMKQNVKVIKT